MAGGSTTVELCCLTLIKSLLLSRESDSDVFLPFWGGKKNIIIIHKKQQMTQTSNNTKSSLNYSKFLKS